MTTRWFPVRPDQNLHADARFIEFKHHANIHDVSRTTAVDERVNMSEA